MESVEGRRGIAVPGLERRHDIVLVMLLITEIGGNSVRGFQNLFPTRRTSCGRVLSHGRGWLSVNVFQQSPGGRVHSQESLAI